MDDEPPAQRRKAGTPGQAHAVPVQYLQARLFDREGAARAQMQTDKTTMKKICKRCGEEKWIEDFYKSPSHRDGRYLKCKACMKELRRYAPLSEGSKTCNRCHVDKPLTEFTPDRGQRDGYRTICRPCSWLSRNKVTTLEQARSSLLRVQGMIDRLKHKESFLVGIITKANQ